MKKSYLLFIIILFILVGTYTFRAGILASKPYCTLQDTTLGSGLQLAERNKKYSDCEPITILLNENISNEQVSLLQNQLSAIQGVYHVTYYSQDQANKNYREINKNDPILLKRMPKGHSFLASIDVYVVNPNLKTSVVDKIRQTKNNSIIKNIINRN